MTADGYKPIEQITAGDYVYAENPETGEKGLKQVVQIFENEKDELVEVYIDDEIIDTTTGHPFWVEGKGWTDAKDLQAGDQVRLKTSKTATIDKVEIIFPKERVKVYNFEVEDWHTYYVSEMGVLVHNMCGGKGAGNTEKALSREAELLRTGGNNTTINVKTKAEADALLKEAFPGYQKVNGVGPQDPMGIRKKAKMDRFKQGGAYHKDYAIDPKTGIVRGHDMNNIHGAYPHINIKRLDGKKVLINIIGG